MYTDTMAERKNRTIYISNSLMEKAISLGKKMDRSSSRIIEYALAAYLQKKGIAVDSEDFEPE